MRTLLALVLAAFLTLTATASAKSILGGKACGADGCLAFGSAAGGNAALEGGPPTSAPAEKAPFFRLRFKVGEDKRSFGYIRVVYVPSEALLRSGDGTWMEPPAHTLAAVNRLVRGLRPYPAARMPGVLEPYVSNAAAATPAPPRPSSGGGGGGGLPALAWAGAAAVMLAALAAAGWRRHGPAQAG